MKAAPTPERIAADAFGKPPAGWRRRLYNVIFESDTRSGRIFDIVLVCVIVLSIVVVVLDSVPAVRGADPASMNLLEWSFTALFTLEYLARLASVRRPWRYATSFFGIIDLLSVLPTYFSLFVPEAAALLDIRILRLLRIFRIFKLTLYINEYTMLGSALRASGRKILVFLSVVLMAVLILGTVMYVVEGPKHGYTSIPVAMYWATVTMTTVGYGDITPQTGLGKLIASFMMLLGWGILAVPTGIVTAEMTSLRMRKAVQEQRDGDDQRTRDDAEQAGQQGARGVRHCPACGSAGHGFAAVFCKDCGAELSGKQRTPDTPHV